MPHLLIDPMARRGRRPQVDVRLSTFVAPLLLWVLGLCAYGVHVYFAELGTVARTSLSEGWFVILFALAYLGMAIVHELGHVVAYRVLGMGWDRIAIGAGLAVQSLTPRSVRAQLLISASGPLLHMVVGSLVLSCAGSPWTFAGLVGLAGIIDGALNLALPLGRNTDASKIYRSLWAILRGRGRQLV